MKSLRSLVAVAVPAPTCCPPPLVRTALHLLAARTSRVAVLVTSTVGAATAQVGTNYCTPAISNSSGVPAAISSTGTSVVHLNNLVLTSSGLPLNSFGFFLTSRDQGSVFPVNSSQGRLCLGGFIGRYVGQGQILNSGATGSFALAIDSTSMPQPFGNVAVQHGDTWNFQCWFRDTVVGGGATSNFSDGLEVMFTVWGGTITGMVPIPAGTFLMGSDAASGLPYHGDASQQPVHQVTISSPFWMGQHEVTQTEYETLIGSNPSYFPGAMRPVEQVSWHEARTYCTALTAQLAGNLPSGYAYRLPTEAEWEYACRAGTTTEFHYGPELFCNQAQLGYSTHSNSHCNTSGTVPVGSYAPNAFGLYDMHGNVYEWCLDSYSAYSSAAVTDPLVTGGASRVLRGGGWRSNSFDCRSAYRHNSDPGFTDIGLGFRVVLAPGLVP